MRCKLTGKLGVLALIITLSLCQAAAAGVNTQAINPNPPKQGQAVTVTSTGAHANPSGAVQMVELRNSYRVAGALVGVLMAGSQGSTLMNGQSVKFAGANSAVGMFSCNQPAGTNIEIESELVNVMTGAQIHFIKSTITVAP